ncbi:hypothetical protein K7711_17325 [Nocardia sp. CA2R105]|uniref:hypothetical protein n=1 Tax=Nocardia coffeae TaxID=2873381 RepID=UPI001CA601CF|nr:hypothetical protein [Nocardia coffeae]MBY8858246.1 hypothetical protein [Nocardia coffeae]
MTLSEQFFEFAVIGVGFGVIGVGIARFMQGDVLAGISWVLAGAGLVGVGAAKMIRPDGEHAPWFWVVVGAGLIGGGVASSIGGDVPAGIAWILIGLAPVGVSGLGKLPPIVTDKEGPLRRKMTLAVGEASALAGFACGFAALPAVIWVGVLRLHEGNAVGGTAWIGGAMLTVALFLFFGLRKDPESSSSKAVSSSSTSVQSTNRMSVHYALAHRFLPLVALDADPTEFLAMFQPDRAEASIRLLFEMACDWAEMPPDFEAKDVRCVSTAIPETGHVIFLFEFPPPRRLGEAYRAACVGKLSTPQSARTRFRYLTMERSMDFDGHESAVLAEWLDNDGTRANFGSAPSTDAAGFLEAIGKALGAQLGPDSVRVDRGADNRRPPAPPLPDGSLSVRTALVRRVLPIVALDDPMEFMGMFAQERARESMRELFGVACQAAELTPDFEAGEIRCVPPTFIQSSARLYTLFEFPRPRRAGEAYVCGLVGQLPPGTLEPQLGDVLWYRYLTLERGTSSTHPERAVLGESSPGGEGEWSTWRQLVEVAGVNESAPAQDFATALDAYFRNV